MIRSTFHNLVKRLKGDNLLENVRSLHKSISLCEGHSEDKKKNIKPGEYSEPKTVLMETDGPITLIGINRPDQRNAINASTAQQLCEAFREFENNEKSFVAVLYGVGGSFSSGYDINEIVNGDNISIDLLMLPEGSVGPTRRHIKKPVVCAVNGYCVANGLELALMCDLRVMEKCAVLGFFNRRFGVPIIDGGTARLPFIIGFARALELVLTGRQVCADEAYEMGLVNKLVATGTSLGQAVNLANCIAKFPQAALRHDRNSLYSATFEAANFNQAIQNEIMYTSKEILEEMRDGMQKFCVGEIKGSSTANVKEKSMADWEKEELKKECENKTRRK